MSLVQATTAGAQSAAEVFVTSVTGRQWILTEVDERLAGAIAERHRLDPLMARLVANRCGDMDAVGPFLDPRLRELLPNPSCLADMDRAATRIASAVEKGETIGLLADYDVDGATSAALMMGFLNAVGARHTLHVPDRLAEGYGPSELGIDRLVDAGARLVVTLDCGTTAFDPIAHAVASGLDVVVIDHHAAEPRLPDAMAVVNPNRVDAGPECRSLAAVGVTFLAVVAVNRELRRNGYYSVRDMPEPDLLQWLDLVALGTVCDVVPLVGLNRAFVTQGLQVLGKFRNPGLTALAEVAGLKERVSAHHLGFVLGPRVNAGGRIGRAELGARLLSGAAGEEVRAIARELDDCNRERQAIEQRILESAIRQAESQAQCTFLLVAEEGWHPGVVGIVASRLVETFGKPALVVALEGGVGRGSGRSIPGIDLGAAVIAARQAGVLLAAGGHPAAAGFTLPESVLETFRAFLEDRFAGRVPVEGVRPPLRLEGVLAPEALTAELLDAVERVGPYGAGNPRPRFAVTGARIGHTEVVGQRHVRVRLGGGVRAIAFRQAESELGRTLMQYTGRTIDIAGRLEADTWRGDRKVQFVIEDAAAS